MAWGHSVVDCPALCRDRLIRLFGGLLFGGLGSAVIKLDGATVAALVVTNAVGDIINPDTGAWVAGVRLEPAARKQGYLAPLLEMPVSNTTLVVVATDAKISKAQAHALSQSAHIGIARVTRPSHTVHDGDTAYVLSTGRAATVSMMALSVAVQEVVANAILNGVRAANS